MPSIQAAALQVGVEVIATKVYAKDEIEAVIAAQARDPGDGLILMPNGFNAVNQEFIFALAARYRVPAFHCNPIYAGSSGLMTYGSDFVEAYRLAAGYIDRVLKGAKPGELPIQMPNEISADHQGARP
jgi:putative ABC transport system substrate-binding protein